MARAWLLVGVIIGLLGAAVTAIAVRILDSTYPPGREDLFWMYSAAAQTVAAFAGLVIAGFFFAQSQADVLAQRDETLQTPMEELRRVQYREFVVLVLLAVGAIVGSIGVILLNNLAPGWLAWWHPISVFLVAAALIWGAFFLLQVGDPRALQRTAGRQLRTDAAVQNEAPAPQGVVDEYESRADIIETVDEIQRLVYAAYQDLGPRIMQPGADIGSLRYAIESLHQDGRITTPLRQMLFDFVRVRNAVAHAADAPVDARLIGFLRRLRAEVKTQLERRD